MIFNIIRNNLALKAEQAFGLVITIWRCEHAMGR